MTSPSAQPQSVLRHPNVLRFIGGRFLASLGAQIQVVAVGWQMYDITGDPLDLGLIGLSQFIPFMALILPAGHAADNYNRARIVTTCYLTSSIVRAGTADHDAARFPVGVADLSGHDGAGRLARVSRCRPRSRSCRTSVPTEAFRRTVALNSSTHAGRRPSSVRRSAACCISRVRRWCMRDGHDIWRWPLRC